MLERDVGESFCSKAHSCDRSAVNTFRFIEVNVYRILAFLRCRLVVITDVSGQPVDPTFKGQAAQKTGLFDFWRSDLIYAAVEAEISLYTISPSDFSVSSVEAIPTFQSKLHFSSSERG